ncbi:MULTISPECIES: P-II family nitrogen regulator [Corynebacterium]|uniref:P-II family nitrogen regulator n=1 Tax=Corynebacterium TaxID=1716 RepID=UPI001195F5F0|nr:P-II family nitrogen regulator [Corynebacterium hadale]TVX79870.1 P-II family nitrogen regulator [Corynebacterium sp. NML180780]WKC60803.1 Nitrogen regulatory protein P-II [Corynebacterium hadale]
MPKLKLEIVTGEGLADRAVDAILRAASTGTIGDGKIWISPVDDVIRVRTGERGEQAP